MLKTIFLLWFSTVEKLSKTHLHLREFYLDNRYLPCNFDMSTWWCPALHHAADPRAQINKLANL
jgi:hypothetical protein